jgi:hypothetical protein
VRGDPHQAFERKTKLERDLGENRRSGLPPDPRGLNLSEIPLFSAFGGNLTAPPAAPPRQCQHDCDSPNHRSCLTSREGHDLVAEKWPKTRLAPPEPGRRR